MKFMNCYITIGDLIFRHCNAVKIEESWKNITQRATVKLPNIKGLLDKTIKRGDAVLIQLGYDGELITEFEGYVSLVAPKIPLEIECEDEMWKQKQTVISKSWDGKVTLSDIIKYLVADAQLSQIPDITISDFRIDNVSVAQAFEKLKDEYGLVVYYRDKKLFVGLAYYDVQPSVNYHFQKNIPFNQDDLKYVSKDDIQLKVKAISIQPDNTQIEVELGDVNGEQQTLHFFNLTEDELKVQAQNEINLMKYDGYRGRITAFGKPKPVHGGTMNLYDDKYPEREGSFFIDGVVTEYNSNGFRREVDPGRKSNADLIQ